MDVLLELPIEICEGGIRLCRTDEGIVLLEVEDEIGFMYYGPLTEPQIQSACALTSLQPYQVRRGRIS